MSDVIGVAVAALAGFAASALTNRRERRTSLEKHQIEEGALELDERRVDGEVYERAEQSYLKLISTLQQEITRLESIVENLRRDLAETQEKRSILESRVRDLEASAATMKQLLRDAGVEYAELTSVEDH